MMAPALKIHQACVQFADPAAPEGVQVSTPDFLQGCYQSALARFHTTAGKKPGCRTIQHVVPPKLGDEGSTGTIVAHLSPAFCAAWQADMPLSLREKRAQVDAEIHLALEDLADQDMHGYLAMTRAQCAIYAPDLVQLVHEALERTSFSKLGRRADPKWEGTLVERVQPPYLVLVISIGMPAAKPAKQKRAKTRGTVGARGRRSR